MAANYTLNSAPRTPGTRSVVCFNDLAFVAAKTLRALKTWIFR